MKKFIFIVLVIATTLSINLHAQTSEADYILTLDFSAEQTGIPKSGYAAAYLVNTTDVELVFYLSYPSVLRSAYIWREGGRDRREEIFVDLPAYNATFSLKPGARIRIFSLAFTSGERAAYPLSKLNGICHEVLRYFESGGIVFTEDGLIRTFIARVSQD